MKSSWVCFFEMHNNSLVCVAEHNDIRALTCAFYILLYALCKRNDIACGLAESPVRRDEYKKRLVDKTIWLLEQKVNPDKISFALYSVL